MMVVEELLGLWRENNCFDIGLRRRRLLRFLGQKIHLLIPARSAKMLGIV